MDDYDVVYDLYDSVDTEGLRAYRAFVDLFPPLSSPVALERWDEANERLAERRAEIEAARRRSRRWTSARSTVAR